MNKKNRFIKYAKLPTVIIAGSLVFSTPYILQSVTPPMFQKIKDGLESVIVSLYQAQDGEVHPITPSPTMTADAGIFGDSAQEYIRSTPIPTKREAGGKILKLEDSLDFKDYSIRELTHWENITLARLIPLKSIIEIESDHYNIDPVFATKLLILESSMVPVGIDSTLKDFGLGQTHIATLWKMLRMVNDQDSPYFNPRYDTSKGVFDPNNNIILSFASLRYIQDRRKFPNHETAYAVYARGDAAVDKNFRVTDLARGKVKDLNQRTEYIANVIPLFAAQGEDLKKINDEVTKGLINIHNLNLSTEESYKQIADLLYESLNKNGKDTAYSSVLFEDAATFHVTCSELYNYSGDRFDSLIKIGKSLLEIVKDQDYSDRIRGSINYLEASKHDRSPFDTIRGINRSSIR